MMRSTAPPSRRDFWASHRDDTEARVIEAYLELLERSSALTISMPAVAARAGLSVRTLYRYFPRKDDLQQAASGWLDRRALAALAGRELDLDSLRSYLPALWRDFADHIQAVRVQHAGPGGRALRIDRLAETRARVDRALAPAITGDRRSTVVDLIAALGSSSMFLELVDRMGRGPDDAAETVVDLIELIVANEVNASKEREP